MSRYYSHCHSSSVVSVFIWTESTSVYPNKSPEKAINLNHFTACRYLHECKTYSGLKIIICIDSTLRFDTVSWHKLVTSDPSAILSGKIVMLI